MPEAEAEFRIRFQCIGPVSRMRALESIARKGIRRSAVGHDRYIVGAAIAEETVERSVEPYAIGTAVAAGFEADRRIEFYADEAHLFDGDAHGLEASFRGRHFPHRPLPPGVSEWWLCFLILSPPLDRSCY